MSLFRKETPAEHYPVEKPDAEWRASCRPRPTGCSASTARNARAPAR